MVMTPAQLQDLAKSPGITVGSHTVRHRRLDTLPEAEARQELFDSKKNLEDILGQPVPLFSFPHGAFTDRVLSLARDAGYQTVYTISPTCAREQMNGFVAGRVKVDPDDWMIEFRLKLRGAYRWMARG
jgi:peptidoglycan/xylan/chitin deacetylase (PgdA/CDA1 family)